MPVLRRQQGARSKAQAGRCKAGLPRGIPHLPSPNCHAGRAPSSSQNPRKRSKNFPMNNVSPLSVRPTTCRPSITRRPVTLRESIHPHTQSALFRGARHRPAFLAPLPHCGNHVSGRGHDEMKLCYRSFFFTGVLWTEPRMALTVAGRPSRSLSVQQGTPSRTGSVGPRECEHCPAALSPVPQCYSLSDLKALRCCRFPA